MAYNLHVNSVAICLMLAFFVPGTTATVFTEHPSDVVVTEGSDAEFRCGTTDLHCDYFYWRRYEASTGEFAYVSKCLSSYEPSHYNVHREGNVYTLVVKDVSLTQSGTAYECWQYSQADGGWLKSPNATLTVIPDTDSAGPPQPECRTDPPGPHSVGDTVSLECSYTPMKAKTSVVVSWTTGRRGSHLETQSNLKPDQTHRVEWTLSERDNFEQFICRVEAGSKVPSRRGNCTLVPLAIPTNVTISPATPRAVAKGSDVEFRCRAQSVPKVTSYKWLITRGGVTVDLHHGDDVNESGKIIRLSGVSAEEDGTEVVCEASNEFGISGRSLPSVLRVIRPEPVETTTKKDRKNFAKEPGDLTGWSHIALVVGIMLCVVVVFIAAGMGVLYAGWRQRMNAAARGAAAAAAAHSPADDADACGSFSPQYPTGTGGGEFSVRGCALPNGSQLGRLGEGTNQNVYTENVYMEIFGNNTQHQTPAPAHERAVETDHTYERYF